MNSNITSFLNCAISNNLLNNNFVVLKFKYFHPLLKFTYLNFEILKLEGMTTCFMYTFSSL